MVKTVYEADTLLAAHLVAGYLRQEGIEVVVEGESLQGAMGRLPQEILMRPSVRVIRDEDAELAVALMARRRKSIAGTRE